MTQKEVAFIFYRCLLAMADALAKYYGFGKFARSQVKVVQGAGASDGN